MDLIRKSVPGDWSSTRYYRKLKKCSIALRDLASFGQVPGVVVKLVKERLQCHE